MTRPHNTSFKNIYSIGVQWNLYPSFPFVSFFHSYHSFLLVLKNSHYKQMGCIVHQSFIFPRHSFRILTLPEWLFFGINGENNMMFSEHIVTPNIYKGWNKSKMFLEHTVVLTCLYWQLDSHTCKMLCRMSDEQQWVWGKVLSYKVTDQRLTFCSC
jgi:hypothetical protein